MMISLLKQPITHLIGRSKTPRDKPEVEITAPGPEELAINGNLVKDTALFAELTDDEQFVIGKWMRPESYALDEVLFTKEQQSDALYLIQEGWVKLYPHHGSPGSTSLGPGRLLGEVDFFLGRPRTMTACAATDVTVWSLDNNALTQIIAEIPEVGLGLGLALGTGIRQFQNCLAEQLAKIPLLQNLSDGDRSVIAQHLSPQRYLPRETIYRSGDPPTGLFFIETGMVWLLGNTDDDYIELAPGATFGERTIISGRSHANTAQAATEVLLWHLSPADFAILGETYPSIKTRLTQILHASLTEALTIASIVMDNEIDALVIVCGEQHGLIRKLHQVRQILTWLKNSVVFTQ